MKNIDRPMMFIDTPGFGDSDRTQFGPDAETEWIISFQVVLARVSRF